MTANGILQILLFFTVLLLLVKPLGAYFYDVMERQPMFLDRALGPIERLIYRVCGFDPAQEQHWTTYTVAMLLFNFAGLLLLYLLQRVQQWLPLNPQGLAAVPSDLAWNTAVSFTSNTNWQNYSGESTLSYLVQMVGLTFHNVVSAPPALRWRSPWYEASRATPARRSATSGSTWCAAPCASCYRCRSSWR